MDWLTLLKAQQLDFIERLQSGCLLNCKIKGKHSELTVITGQSLALLRNFCWEMVKKYKPNDPRNYFINNMKGKLGEEVIKIRLDDLVTEVDYEIKTNGDGKIDFTLNADSSIGIQVKARHGNFNTVDWSISKEEVNKNAVLVCILIQEEVTEAQAVYNLILAGFIPTSLISSANGSSLKIEELLYSGGLYSYLNNLGALKKSEVVEKTKYSSIEDFNKSSSMDFVSHDAGKQFSKLSYEYLNLGHSYYKQKQYELAINSYNKALSLNPYCVESYFWLGLASSAIKDYQEAVRNFNHVILMKPYEYKGYQNRGLIFLALNDNHKAIQDFSDSINILIKTFALVYYYRGIAFDNLGEIQRSINDYTQSININPDFYAAYLERGISRLNLGDRQGGIDDYNQAIIINPKSDKAYFLRGQAYFKLGNKNKAIHDYNQAIDLNIRNDEYYFYRGYARYTMDDKKGAIEDYTESISLNPYQTAAFTKRGTARYKIGDIQGAIQDYTSAININPKDGITYFNRSFAYYKIGNIQNAINDYTKSLVFQPKLVSSKKARILKKILYSTNQVEVINNQTLELIKIDDEDEENTSSNYTDNYLNYQDRESDYGYLEDLDNDDYYYYFKGCKEL